MWLQLHRGHGHNMLALLQTGVARLFYLGLAGNLINVHGFHRRVKPQLFCDFANHIIRSSNDEQALNIAGSQGLTHLSRMLIIGKNSPLDGLYSILLIFSRGTGQNLGALD